MFVFLYLFLPCYLKAPINPEATLEGASYMTAAGNPSINPQSLTYSGLKNYPSSFGGSLF